MKILLASILPIDDLASWSGTCNAIFQQLSKKHEVQICYSNYAHKAQKQLAKYSYLYNKITGKRLNVYFSKSVSKIYGTALQQSEDTFRPDLILCLGSGTELFDYSPKTKSYLVADACFNLLKDNYSAYSKLTHKAIEESKEVEQVSIVKFDRVFATSQWAKDGFLKNHPSIRCATINLGSNLRESKFTELVIPTKKQELKLLSIGTDYKRKGIDKTEALTRNLGCTIDIIGIEKKLDKTKSDHLKELVSYYQNAHFFVLFPKADCTPIVINEANSFGLPVITFDVGGIGSMIANGQNGYLVKDIDEAQTIIEQMVANPEEYSALRKSTYDYYTQNLSYSIFEQKLLEE
ncbi:MAG: hypothetical protein COA58_00115 [Bacteroidetes bacterium]|nr:MAG: hypothetical protein COA58_00115 [Bacteroidota bacterium]